MLSGSTRGRAWPKQPAAAAAGCRQRTVALVFARQQQQQHMQSCWRQQVPRRHSLLEPCNVAAVDVEPAALLGSVDIESLHYTGGQYTAEGSLLTQATPDTVYEVLTDYEALPRVFHNVESSVVRHCSATGQKQVVQTCKWAFLVFSGTFLNELNVVEDAQRRQLTFSLVESAFMREFVGSWVVRGLPCGTTEVRHRLSVTPVLSPPQRIGDLSKTIFRKQVIGILEDLHQELEARLG